MLGTTNDVDKRRCEIHDERNELQMRILQLELDKAYIDEEIGLLRQRGKELQEESKQLLLLSGSRIFGGRLTNDST